MLHWVHLLAPLILAHLAVGLAEVQLGETTVSGLELPELRQEFFGGIPFAEPPVDTLRFAPPILKLNPGIPNLDATHFGIPCTQGLGFGSMPAPFNSSAVSEDCLTLNVLRPTGLNGSGNESVPVMVWVYGGGFLDGSASMFNGSAIVGQSVERGTPIVYVNLNYRLGPLGFPQGKEAESRRATNLGNKDVLAALTWIKSNIAAFGGDKDKVTVFGESAGSIIIAELLLNKTFDLARAAILESGSAASHRLVRAADREDTWQDFVSGVPECASAQSSSSTFDCLRSASLETIFNATNGALRKVQDEFPFSPVIDGPGGIVPELPSRLFARGEFSRIPLIAGTNLDEGPLFLPTSINSSTQIREWLVSNSTPSPISPFRQKQVFDIILDLYPNIPALGSPFRTGNETFGLDPEFKRAAAITGDIGFTSLRRQWTEAASAQGVKVFAYLFTDPQTLSSPPFLGVPHGSEIVYVYGAPQNGPASVVLSHNMIDYWVSFATSIDPNDGRGNASRTTWTQYTPNSENVMELNGANLTMISDNFRAKQISFLNAHPEAVLH